MTDAAKAHDARYLSFAIDMLLIERNEGIEIERTYNAAPLYVGAADTSAATVRPAKRA